VYLFIISKRIYHDASSSVCHIVLPLSCRRVHVEEPGSHWDFSVICYLKLFPKCIQKIKVLNQI